MKHPYLKLLPFIIMIKFGCFYVTLIYFNWDIAGLKAKGVFINWPVEYIKVVHNPGFHEKHDSEQTPSASVNHIFS